MENFETLPPDFVKTLIRHIKMIKLIGIDIFADKRMNFINKYGRLILFSCFTVPMLVGQILYIMWNNKTGASFLDVVNAIPSTLMVLQDFVKMFVTASKRDQIREIILDIGAVWPRYMSDEKKKNIIKEWTRRTKLYNDAYFTCAIFSLGMFELMPLVVTIYSFSSDPNTQYEFPVQVYFFCWLKSHFQYAMAYIYFMFTCTVTHLCIYISCDLLLVSLTFDVSALINLLQNDLENIVNTTYNKNDNLDDNCEDISRIVITHQNLLRLASRLDDIFGVVIFTQVSFSALIICCFGFLAVIGNGLARNLTAVFGMMFGLFILAWPGQLLVDTSSSVASAAYECSWYDRGVKFRKYIAIILTRSQTPCYLTALGFSELTLVMFSKVLSTAWSYLSLLKQMYQDNMEL